MPRLFIFIAAAVHFVFATTAVSGFGLGPLPKRLRARLSTTAAAQKGSTSLPASAVLNMSSKAYDVVVFGATSYAGALVAEYYLKTYGASPPSFKWAVAARSEEKLTALKKRLSAEVDTAAGSLPTIIADSMDDEAVERMVSQAKVIVTTVGPYNRYGSKLVGACARAGVHYCDLTGESLWVKEMIDKHHAEAESTGAKIVPSCGFDSIPADMGTFLMAEHMERVHGVKPHDVRYYFMKNAGGPSGGTVATVLDVCELAWSGGKEVRRQLNDPLLLTTPAGVSTFKKVTNPGGWGYDSLGKVWTWASPFAGHDAKVVYRSADLLGYPGLFRYKEVMGCKGLLKGLLPAMVCAFSLTVGMVFMVIPVTRRIIAKKLLPSPGEGPSKEARDNGFFWINYVAKGSVDGKEVVCHGKVGSDKGDGGYKETAKMLAECGLCLALDKEVVECKKGGILTTAVAMGMPLIKRMNDAGMTFKVLDN